MKLLIFKIPFMLFPNPFSHVVLQIQDLFSFQWNFLSFHIFIIFVELSMCYTHRCPNALPSHNSVILVYDIVLFLDYGTHFHMLTCTSNPSSQEIPTLVHQKLPVHLSSLCGKTVLLETFSRQLWLFSWLQHLSPSCITISLWTGSIYFLFCFHSMFLRIWHIVGAQYLCEWINKLMKVINEERTEWEAMENS